MHVSDDRDEGHAHRLPMIMEAIRPLHQREATSVSKYIEDIYCNFLILRIPELK